MSANREREDLLRAIEALEAQRAVLGDEVVDAALAPLRERLSAWDPGAEGLRRVVTVLFADLCDFTSLAEGLDPEEVTELLNRVWERLDHVITTHGGRIDKHMGDAVMALWSAETCREDDPERAVRAALQMHRVLACLKDELSARHPGLALQMRVGLNTGPVLLSRVGSTRELTATGDSVNVAAHLAREAPAGGVLVSKETYRLIRGAFRVRSQPAVAVKGRQAPVQAYLVLGPRSRPFQPAWRGIEGIRTPLVGRREELRKLWAAFREASGGRARMVTVLGDAGVGKSRLLREFRRWLARRHPQVEYLKGRASPGLQDTPYSVFRDAFARRLHILESDTPQQVQQKFRLACGQFLPPVQADALAQWIGFDLPATPGGQGMMGSPDMATLAHASLVRYLRGLASGQVVVLLAEDVHWADESSLDLLEDLHAELSHSRLLVVCLARPTLLERRPQWGTGRDGRTTLALPPLSPQECEHLVERILGGRVSVPAPLRELVLQASEGNPLCVEEMITMLIEQGVIQLGRGPHDQGRVDVDRLKGVRVPPTMAGILQARLDALPPLERHVLQRAAVVGRVFWDGVVAELVGVPPEGIHPALWELERRQLVFSRERSAFADSHEYIFKHALVRDAAYETVLLKLRRGLHAQVAHWLKSRAGERIHEHASLLAHHLQQAGLNQEAVTHLRLAGERALCSGASTDALSFCDRALALEKAASPELVRILVLKGRVLAQLGQYEAAQGQFRRALAMGEELGDRASTVGAMLGLANVLEEQAGDWEAARDLLTRALELARAAGDNEMAARALNYLGWVDLRKGSYATARECFSQSHRLCEHTGNKRGAIDALIGLAGTALLTGGHDEAGTLYLECLQLARAGGFRQDEAAVLSCMGERARLQGDHRTAIQYYAEALSIFEEIGNRLNIAVVLANLGHVTSSMGDYASAMAHYRESLRTAWAIGSLPPFLDAVVGMAGALAHTGETTRALSYLGLALNRPETQQETRALAEEVLSSLRARLPMETIAEGLELGKSLSLDQVVREVSLPSAGPVPSEADPS